MQSKITQVETGYMPHDEAKLYLATLQGLARELDLAMDAIVKRELPSLQKSIHLQQSSCGRLSNLRHASRTKLSQDVAQAADSSNSDLAGEIKVATDRLLQLNRSYAALLKHSGDTLRLLAGLYRSYRTSAQPGTLQTNLQTWSCEV